MIAINDLKAKQVQKHVFNATMPEREINSFDSPKASAEIVFAGGIKYVNDINYGNKYPNSFMDIWYHAENVGDKHPTLVYLHGGGNLFGDKVTGDPLADNNESDVAYYKDFAKRGFNVVSANYCFAPEYRAPAQIVQLNELMKYLAENAEKLALDMENVVLMGGSAGACYAAIYGLAVCDKEYASKLGFETAVKKEQIKALVLNELCLTPSAILTNENLTILYTVWLGSTKNIGEPGSLSALLDVTENIKSDYIPSFIVSSNVDEQFYDCTRPLADTLGKIGIPHDFFYLSQEKSEKLAHGFMSNFLTNKYSKDCYDRMISFVEKYL